MKIVLAGSPQISVAAFKEVINAFEVVAIITQPDRRKGRGMKFQETAVASLGAANNIKVFKPNKIKDIYQELKDLEYDLLLSFAFGQYIPSDVLSLGKFPPLNIHGSLLPKYRGASPIHHAILNGDKEMGITLIEMVKEMDAGNMYFKASQNIDESTTTGKGFEIISDLAAANIVKWLKKVEKGESKPQKQSDFFSVSPKIQKEDAKLTKDNKVKEAIRKIRGLNPFPGAFIILNDKRLKVFDVSKEPVKNGIKLDFSDGTLYAKDYQWESKKRVRI